MIFKTYPFKMAVIFLTGALFLPISVNPKPTAEDLLPDMGTTAGATLSIDQEIEMGDFYLREIISHAPLIYDPLLNEYINSLGKKLVDHAQSVKTPFHFYLLNNNQINASAFLGGNVLVNSGLFFYTDNESELASVLAHEISHITQRHLARAIENNQRLSQLTLTSKLGSLLLFLANPKAGMMAWTSSLALAQQDILSLSQSNEQEADRIGLKLLQASGFNAHAMTDFLEKLADESRYTSKPPEMLLTHPLPESRLVDIYNRANQISRHPVVSSQDYLFAKVRLHGLFELKKNFNEFLKPLKKGADSERLAAEYGQAILWYQNKKYDKARQILQTLSVTYPDNIWFLDLMTDIDLSQNKAAQAITRLKKARVAKQYQRIWQLNLANAYIKAGESAQAVSLLRRYTFEHPNDMNGWDLLIKAALAKRWRDQALAAHAENAALKGNFSQAIGLLSDASNLVPLGSLQQARYDARIDQLRQLEQRFKKYQK
ncbi:beta-barrel assembly-enhancing protease [Candidatus Williamhamiltonella defendens]|uniref:Beta-barrel assembly-enhancing protease n=1 Tax=Candidatus Hamiltonella defensa (Bemisia tabaci) TaxID=672795 RepID=A0A249DYX2_9ENTR|nr:M48 family metallopeptidase [Candidatus Hamiltonella defensa]ASX26475.1 hypothetical protein BA171_05240 [Candidatus Hamiltonella defensa (Bemisia tabaci)]CED79034.1 TPR repeat-containing protein yfgC [Candidatus Hamiltonella defensa (Bemisia tabaci)]